MLTCHHRVNFSAVIKQQDTLRQLRAVACMASCAINLFGEATVVFVVSFVLCLALLQTVETLTNSWDLQEGRHCTVAKVPAAHGSLPRQANGSSNLEPVSAPYAGWPGPLLRGRIFHRTPSTRPRRVNATRQDISASDSYLLRSFEALEEDHHYYNLPSPWSTESAVEASSRKPFAHGNEVIRPRQVAVLRQTKSASDMCKYRMTQDRENDLCCSLPNLQPETTMQSSAKKSSSIKETSLTLEEKQSQVDVTGTRDQKSKLWANFVQSHYPTRYARFGSDANRQQRKVELNFKQGTCRLIH